MELLAVRVSAIDEAHFKVIVESTKTGEGEEDSRLPFFETSRNWRTTLIKALEINEYRASFFPEPAEQEWMAQQGWLGSDRQSFHPSMLARIGQAMYNSLFPAGIVRDALQRAIANAEHDETQLHIQLRFSSEVTKRSRLPDYPWELAHDGQRFLTHHQVRFSRYIAYRAVVPKLTSVEKLRVLLVSSGASDEENGLLPLSNREQRAVLKALEKAQAENLVQVEILKPATLDRLREYLTGQQPHILHFDGHGFFGKRCGKASCQSIHKDLNANQCKRCGADLPAEQGYLLFETEEDEADYVSAIQLGSLLQKNRHDGIAVAVLSACKSAMALGGESVFNGIAQQLIHHRLLAVVAMQYTVKVDSAARFAEQFYRSLSHKNSLLTAIGQGQEAMGAEGNQWYRPVLYLRCGDNEEGNLFVSAELGQSAKQQTLLELPRSKPIAAIKDFCDFVAWINDKSQGAGMGRLSVRHKEQFTQALQKVLSTDSQLENLELQVLELVAHYSFYCLKNRQSPKFKKMSKTGCSSQLRRWIDSGKRIRSCSVPLSSLVGEDDLRKLLLKLEEYER